MKKVINQQVGLFDSVLIFLPCESVQKTRMNVAQPLKNGSIAMNGPNVNCEKLTPGCSHLPTLLIFVPEGPT